MSASVLEHLPINLQDLNEAVTSIQLITISFIIIVAGSLNYYFFIKVPKPDMDRFVFLRAQDNLRGILVDDMSADGR